MLLSLWQLRIPESHFQRNDVMKVSAFKSIQSLHAFVRHLRRRSGQSLLLLHKVTGIRTILFISGLCIFFSFPAVAQDKLSDPKKSEENRLDLLFDRIMRTLPDEERTRVDSAAAMKSNHAMPSEKANTADDFKKVNDQTTRLRELPPALKEQVERAMEDIKERNLERKAQFIDSRRGKK